MSDPNVRVVMGMNAFHHIAVPADDEPDPASFLVKDTFDDWFAQYEANLLAQGLLHPTAPQIGSHRLPSLSPG